MKHNSESHMEVILKKRMEALHLAPRNALKIDGGRHVYDTVRKGKTRKATYSASIDSFGSNSTILTCTMGIADSPRQYSISVIQQPNGRHVTKLTTNGKQRIQHD